MAWHSALRGISVTGVDAVVEKLVCRRKGRREIATVSSIRSTINEQEENAVSHWRSRQAISHMVSEPEEWSTPVAVAVVSIVDHTNQESVCTALLVRELLKRFFPFTGPGHVLGHDEHLPESTTLLLVMSSNGCFQRPSFVRQLFQAEKRGIGAVPIIVDDRFQHPSDVFFQELRALSAHILSGTGLRELSFGGFGFGCFRAAGSDPIFILPTSVSATGCSFLGLTVWSCVFCCTVSNWLFLSFNRLSIDSEKTPICFLFVGCCCIFDSLEPQTQLMKRKSFARRSGQNLKLKTSFRFLRRKSTTLSQSNFSERCKMGWFASVAIAAFGPIGDVLLSRVLN